MRQRVSHVLPGLLLGGLLLAPNGASAQEPPGPAPGAPAPADDKKPATLAELRKQYADYEAGEQAFWDYLNMIAAEEREIFALAGKMQEAREASNKKLDDAQLKQTADVLEKQFKDRADKHQARRPEYMKRQKAHMEKLQLILRAIDDLEKKTNDPAVAIFRVKFIADQGGWNDVYDEARRLYKEHPDDHDTRLVYGQTQMVIPFDPRDKQRAEPKSPCFDRAYAALAPLAKAEPANQGLQLLFGVAAGALGKNDEARRALDSVAVLDSIRPAQRIIIGNPNDPEASFKVWRECADGLAAKPDDATLHQRRGEQLMRLDAARYAIADLDAAAKGKPDDLDAWCMLARCYAQANDFDSAVKTYQAIFARSWPTWTKKDEPSRKDETAKKDEPAKKDGGATDGAVKKDGEDGAKKIDPPTQDMVRCEYGVSLLNANKIAESKAELEKIVDPTKLPAQLQEALKHYQPGGPAFQGVPGRNGAAASGGTGTLVDEWAKEEAARAEDAKRDDNPRVALETERGTITLELFEDAAPNTVANFVWLAANGFYDGVVFHRVLTNFMAQGGDPTGTGMGGPGYTIKDEVDKDARLHWRGSLSMAKAAAPNTGGSQFFLCYEPTIHLNGRHTVFGRIVEGQSVVDAIEPFDAIVKATVLRKRKHDYKPETLEQPGHTPWQPGQPREGDKPKVAEGPRPKDAAAPKDAPPKGSAPKDAAPKDAAPPR